MREHQTRFNRGGFVQRALAEGYTCCRYETRIVQLAGILGDVRVSLLGWREATGRLRFYAQSFQTLDGGFVPGTFLDPKYLLDDDGVHYKLVVPPPRTDSRGPDATRPLANVAPGPRKRHGGV